ncbi:MAG: N-acetylmuramoyl-L-alanine amidase, partial [Chlamydiia bacterium]|nr:N-acetylmuramoyl-L-alanine amidase [Chlamydiia bacterium]
MKKNIIHILFALLPLLSVAQKQDLSTLPDLFEGTKICLDPGHGGHDSDDRETQVGYGIIYWESDGVFAQANYASEILEALGANVNVTRHTNDTHADDRQPSLSERVAIGNTFDADIFHSIHTNGSSDKNINYTAVLKYKTAGAYESEINRMIAIMNPHIYDVAYTTAKRSWGQGLGVLNGNNQPAILSEASFHSNSKEGRRLNNSKYQKALAYSYVRSFIDYFDLADYPTGEIGGKVLYSNYKSTNMAKLSLFSSDGTLVESQYTDIGYNGYFMFELLTPGTYSVTVEVEGIDIMTIEDV